MISLPQLLYKCLYEEDHVVDHTSPIENRTTNTNCRCQFLHISTVKVVIKSLIDEGTNGGARRNTKLIRCNCDDVGITSYHQMIVLRVQTFNIKHFPTCTVLLTEFSTLLTEFNKSSDQQLPENVRLMFLQDTALQD